jgi:hypothetical protein
MKVHPGVGQLFDHRGAKEIEIRICTCWVFR